MVSGRPRSEDESADETRPLTREESEAVAAAADGLPVAPLLHREVSEIAVVRRSKAVSLRAAGLDWDRVAEQAGYNTIDAARRAVQAAIAAHEADTVAALRDMENFRLDRQLAAVWARVIGGEVQAGRLALQISERRSKLNGLDKPVEVALSPGSQEIAAWVSQVIALTGSTGLTEPDVIDVEYAETSSRDDSGEREL